MNQVVASLEARALVGRVPHPFHGRILQTSLTERGRSLLAAAHERVRATATDHARPTRRSRHQAGARVALVGASSFQVTDRLLAACLVSACPPPR
jgi:DNA-binding MarR family transcriptional regulator